MRLNFVYKDTLDPHSPAFNPWPDFTAALRSIVPDMPEDAVVYEVDSFGPDSTETQLSAAVISDGEADPETIVTRVVEKAWLRDFVEAFEAEKAASEAPTDAIEEAAPEEPSF